MNGQHTFDHHGAEIAHARWLCGIRSLVSIAGLRGLVRILDTPNEASAKKSNDPHEKNIAVRKRPQIAHFRWASSSSVL